MDVFSGFINFDKIIWGIKWTQRDISYLRTRYKTWAELEDFCRRVKKYYGVDEKMRNVQIRKELTHDSCGLGTDNGYYVISVANEGDEWVEKAIFNYDDNRCNHKIDCEDTAKASAIQYAQSLEECTVGIPAKPRNKLKGRLTIISNCTKSEVTAADIKNHFNQYLYQKFDKNDIINYITGMERDKNKPEFIVKRNDYNTNDYDIHFIPVYLLDKVKGREEMVAMFPYNYIDEASKNCAIKMAQEWIVGR
jgi:hypothetical protein